MIITDYTNLYDSLGRNIKKSLRQVILKPVGPKDLIRSFLTSYVRMTGRRSSLNTKAFSLVELMVVVLIFTVVMAGIYSTFIVGNRAWNHYNDSIVVKKDARRALFELTKDLRDAENIKVIQSANASSLHFHQPKVGKVTYIWSNEGDDANKIIRRSRLGSRTVAQNISELNLQNLRSAVTVNITAGKQTTAGDFSQVVLREKVAIRSKTSKFH